MRKLTLLFIALVASHLVAISQETTTVTISESNLKSRKIGFFGMKVALNASSANITSETSLVINGSVLSREQIALPRFAGGFYFNIPIKVGNFELLAIQPELMYSAKGFLETGDMQPSGSYDVIRRLDYIDIPVLLSIEPVKDLYFLIGPQFSFLISEESELDYSSGNPLFDSPDLLKEYGKSFAMGLSVGVDAYINKFLVSFRYAIDLQDNGGGGGFGDLGYKNSVLQFAIGFKTN